MYKTLLAALLLAAFALSGFAADQKVTKQTTTVTSDKSKMTITEVCHTDADLSTFCEVKAVQTSLSGKGPYTVFAPSNTVYKSAGNNKVTYYIVEGKAWTPAELRAMNKQVIKTTSGDELLIEVRDNDAIWVGNCEVPTTSYMASNGVIYKMEGPMTCVVKPK